MSPGGHFQHFLRPVQRRSAAQLQLLRDDESVQKEARHARLLDIFRVYAG